MAKLRTVIDMNPFLGADIEREIEIDYTVHRGCQATYTRPGEDDTVSLHGIKIIDEAGKHDGDWLIGHLEDDDEIIALCLQDAWEDRIAAEEQRAEMIRDDRLMEGF